MRELTDQDAQRLTEFVKAAIDAQEAFDALPVRIVHSRDGWAGYRGTRRLTKFRFSEAAARLDCEYI